MARRGRSAEPIEIPAHPYRGSAVLYAALSIVLLLVAFLTGGDMLDAVVVAIAFFVLATAWSWWRFSKRIRERDALDSEDGGTT